MDCERDGISVLVVDDDEISLAILANILIAWKCKVLTAKSVRNALETLREFEGFFDLVITEFHMPGILSGFEFQKHVKDEFQIPVIMMSENNRKNVISKSLEDDAKLFIMKPFCADDFKNIWKYAIDARKEKLVIENKLRSGEGDETLSSTEPKSKRKYCKRKCQREDQIEGRFRAIKKPKIVWTTYLHSLFLFAIKHLGMDKAVPKKILEVMNVPTLTRENVASHLQKYRIFLRKVAEKGMIEGLSHRALRSKFASGLPISVIQKIKTRSEKLHHVHAQQYLQSVSYQTGNALKPKFNQVPISLVNQQVSSNNNTNYVSTTQLGRSQYPYLHQGLMLQNEYANPLKSSFGSNIGTNNNNINQNMLGRFAKSPYNLSNCSYNNGAMFSAYGGGHGLMTSAKCLSGGLNLKYGDPLNQNYGSIGNHNYGYGLGNWNMGSLSSSSNILPYYPSINSSGIQLNGGSQMVETVKKGGFNSVGINAATPNNKSFGFMNGTQNANMNVASLVLESFGLAQGRFGFDSFSNAGIGRGSELPATLITAENISGIAELPQLKLDGNSVENEHQFSNATSISESEVNQIEDDLSELFLMLDDMNLLNEMEEIPNASEFWNSDFSNSCQVVQPLEQFNRAGDVIVLPAKITSNLPNESPTSSEQNSNQLGGDDGFANREPYDNRTMGDNVSSASTTATDEDWDMELIEALFGTVEN